METNVTRPHAQTKEWGTQRKARCPILMPDAACRVNLSLKALSEVLVTSRIVLSDSPRIAAIRREPGSHVHTLKFKQLAPRVAPDYSVIVKSIVALERPDRSLRIVTVDAVGAARAAVVA